MVISLVLQGLGLGLAIAAPVGAIGTLCINRTLTQGRWIGFVSGLGAATADGLYGCVAGFGLTAIAQPLLQQGLILRGVGGLFLLYLGIRTLLSPIQTIPQSLTKPIAPSPQPQSIPGTNRRLPTTTIPLTPSLQAYGSTFLLTLMNPMTVLSFTGVFAGLGVGSAGHQARSGAEALALVLGVFLGSALWWLLLSWGVGLLRHRLTAQHLRWINWASGAIVIGFAIASFATLHL